MPRYQTSVTVTTDTYSAQAAQAHTEALVRQARQQYHSARTEYAIGETTVAPEPVRTAFTVMLTSDEHRRAVAQYGNILVPVPVTEPVAEPVATA